MAYCDNDLNSNLDKMLIITIGYIASFLFYCSGKGCRHNILNFTNRIHYYEAHHTPNVLDKEKQGIKDIEEENDYVYPLKGAHISVSKTVLLFSYILTYAWGILLISRILRYIEKVCSLSLDIVCNNETTTCRCSPTLLRVIEIVIAIFFTMATNKLLSCFFVEKYLRHDDPWSNKTYI